MYDSTVGSRAEADLYQSGVLIYSSGAVVSSAGLYFAASAGPWGALHADPAVHYDAAEGKRLISGSLVTVVPCGSVMVALDYQPPISGGIMVSNTARTFVPRLYNRPAANGLFVNIGSGSAAFLPREADRYIRSANERYLGGTVTTAVVSGGSSYTYMYANDQDTTTIESSYTFSGSAGSALYNSRYADDIQVNSAYGSGVISAGVSYISALLAGFEFDRSTAHPNGQPWALISANYSAFVSGSMTITDNGSSYISSVNRHLGFRTSAVAVCRLVGGGHVFNGSQFAVLGYEGRVTSGLNGDAWYQAQELPDGSWMSVVNNDGIVYITPRGQEPEGRRIYSSTPIVTSTAGSAFFRDEFQYISGGILTIE